MKFITEYFEFDDDNKNKLVDNISDKEIPEKESVVRYLKAGSDNGVRCSSIFDYVKQQYVPKTIHRYTDGEYYWDDEEIYHFEKYNMTINSKFIEKVLKQSA